MAKYNKDLPTDKKEKSLFKSYSVIHKSNPLKLNLLFDLYHVYKTEYKGFVHSHWHNFLVNNYHLTSTLFAVNYSHINNTDYLAYFNNLVSHKPFVFTHLGSTKHIKTELNASYLQGCLQQVSSTLNGYLSSIQNRCNLIISKSSLNKITNKSSLNNLLNNDDLLHQLRSINYNRAWLHNNCVYYPVITIMDDYGNLITTKHKKPTFVSKEALTLAKQIFRNIINTKIKFPSTHKPKFVLDDRTCEIEPNDTSSSFDYWLNISTLNKGKKVLIPVKSNDYFHNAIGLTGKTVELNFNHFDYLLQQHKHDSLNNTKQHNKLISSNRKLNITFNKKYTFNEQLISMELTHVHNINNVDYYEYIKNKIERVGFDLGLSTLIATSEGELYGRHWLEKLSQYDNKITMLAKARQQLGLKTRSKRYDNLIMQVRGFIKSEINRILNKYFELKHNELKKIVIEKLYFNNPALSKKLNRIIKNFGQKIFNDKLNELGLIYNVEIEEVNSAYTSQECNECHYIDKKNRTTQSQFKCLCCGKKNHADYNAGKTIVGRSNDDIKVLLSGVKSRVQVLDKLKERFVKEIPTLLMNRKVSRRKLYLVLKDNEYYTKDEIKVIVSTTEGQGVVPAVI